MTEPSARVTELRPSDALRASEERFRAQFKSMPIPTYLWRQMGPDLVFIDYNDAAANFTHGQVAELSGKSATELYGDTPEILDDFMRCLTDRRVIKREMLYELKSTGETKRLDVSFVFVPPDLVMVHTEDITERWEIAQALRESEERFRALSESTTEGIAIHKDGVILVANQVLADIFGYRLPEMIGKPILDFAAPESRELVLEHSRSGVEHTYEAVGLRKDGSEFPCEVIGKNISFRGDPARVSAVRDITERKRAEEALRQSERKYRLLMEEASDGIFVSDKEGNYLDANTQGCELLGYSREELLKLNVRDLIPAEDLLATPLRMDDVVGGQTVRLERRIRRRDGTFVDVEVSTKLIANDLVQAIVRDISERKRTARALAESEQCYRSLFEYNPDAVYSFDLEGNFLTANPACQILSGYRVEDLLHRSFLPLVVEEERDRTLRHFQRAASGAAQNYETTIWHQDGSRREISVTNLPIFVDGKIVGVYGVAKDISERKRAEEAVRQSEERLRAVITNTPIVIFTTDREGIFTISAGKGLERAGIRPGELVGQSAFELFGPAEMIEITGQVLTGAEALRRVFAGETLRVMTEFNTRCFDNHLAPHRDAEDRVIGLLGIAIDITARKRAEDALHERGETIRALIEASPLAIFALDTDDRIVMWNPAAERIFGWTEQEVIGRPIPIITDQDTAEFLALRERIMQGEVITNVERVRRRKDGSGVEVSISAAAFYGPSGEARGIVALLADITERRQVEAALRESEDHLRQSQKMEAIGRLAGGVAHDFNNLLTAIGGQSDLALLSLSPEDPLRRRIEQIKSASDRAAALTQQILAFSRKQVLQPKIVDLNEIVSELGKMLPRLIGEHVELVTVLKPPLGRVSADPTQIEQIILNLAVNARDAMPHGGTLTIETANHDLETSVVQSGFSIQPGRYVMLAVTDTGMGMDAEVQKRIFEPFFTTKETGKGTGLGLAMVYGIVKQSGGYILVESEPGRGAAFNIYLPRIEEELPAHEPVDSPSELLRGAETILVVEDEATIRDLTREFLEMIGYRVLEAAKGADALEVSEHYEGVIDLLITDIVMPGMSGWQLAERLESSRPDMKVLFMSGYTDDAILNHGNLKMGLAFIQKPFDLESFATKVREVIDS